MANESLDAILIGIVRELIRLHPEQKEPLSVSLRGLRAARSLRNGTNPFPARRLNRPRMDRRLRADSARSRSRCQPRDQRGRWVSLDMPPTE